MRKNQMRPYRTAIIRTGCVAACVIANAEAHATIQNKSIRSERLSAKVTYEIYSPPIMSATASYPVLYVMNPGSENGTSDLGAIGKALDELVDEGFLPPVYVVSAPKLASEARQDGPNYYLSDNSEIRDFRTFFVEDFIPRIENEMRAVPADGSRWIAGSGIGGYTALSLALEHAGLFDGVASWNAYEFAPVQLVEMAQSDYDRHFGFAWGAGISGAERITQRYLDESIYGRLRDIPPGGSPSIRIHIEAPDAGPVAAGNKLVVGALQKKGLEYSFSTSNDGLMGSPSKAGWARGLAYLSGMEGEKKVSTIEIEEIGTSLRPTSAKASEGSFK